MGQSVGILFEELDEVIKMGQSVGVLFRELYQKYIKVGGAVSGRLV